MKNRRNTDRAVGVFFLLLIVAFIIAMTNEAFFDWAFRRHQNQLSWYSRPLFLIPFCYFAYRRSLAGTAISLFALFTSMFWFPAPDEVSPQVREFLAFEKSYLTEGWTVAKIFTTMTVPVSLFLLALAFWKRNMWFGISVVVLMAVGKIIWSVLEAGEAGKSILIPAIIGLLLTVTVVIIGIRSAKKRSES